MYFDAFFQLLICRISLFRYIDIYSDDVIKVKVTMIDQISKMAKFGNYETLVFCVVFGNCTPLRPIAKLFTVPYFNTITNRASVSYLLINQNFLRHVTLLKLTMDMRKEYKITTCASANTTGGTMNIKVLNL